MLSTNFDIKLMNSRIVSLELSICSSKSFRKNCLPNANHSKGKIKNISLKSLRESPDIFLGDFSVRFIEELLGRYLKKKRELFLEEMLVEAIIGNYLRNCMKFLEKRGVNGKILFLDY